MALLNNPEMMAGIGTVSRQAQDDPLLDEFPALPEAAAPFPTPSDKNGVQPTGEIAAGISILQIGGPKPSVKGAVPGAFRAPAAIRVPALEKGRERRGARSVSFRWNILLRLVKLAFPLLVLMA